MYKVYYTRHAQKDAKKLNNLGLKDKTKALLEILANDPWRDYPPFEKLSGDLDGCYSRRINLKHRLVYQILQKEKNVKVIRMWSHYGDN